MKAPSYIILLESGERLDLSKANELCPNEYSLGERLIFAYEPNDPNESRLFEVDDPNDPDRATTIPYALFSADGTLLAMSERVTIFWL